jgi:hypothetical protein
MRFSRSPASVQGGVMASAQSISLGKFTSAVKAALKTAIQKHPKFSSVTLPDGITFGYLIRGIPAPPLLLSQVSFAELQAFTDDLAAGIVSQAGIEARTLPSGKGAIYSAGGHIICGIPPVTEMVLTE